MALAQEIAQLRDASLDELRRIHDYFTDSNIAWQIVQTSVKKGRKLRHQSQATGTITDAASLAEKSRRYVAEYIAEATFQQFVATFESFFFDLLRLWLTAHPHSLAGKELLFRTVLDAPDKDAVTLEVVNKKS